MLDRLFDLPFVQRLLAYVALALLIGAYVVASYMPRSKTIAEKQSRIVELEAEKKTLETQLADRETIEAEIAEVERSFVMYQAQLPEEKEIPELLRQVSNLGRESGLDVLSFKQRPEALQDLHAEVPVLMSVRGGFHQIAFFFDKVRHMNRIVNIGDISIKNPRLRDGQMQVDGTFFATTYRFLNEAEQERIAKKKQAQKKKSRRRR